MTKIKITDKAGFTEHSFTCYWGTCAKDARGFGFHIEDKRENPEDGQEMLIEHIKEFHPRIAKKVAKSKK